MTGLCPFFKEDCKGNQCVMWHNENCVLVNFLQTQIEYSEGFELPPDQIISPHQEDISSISDYIKTISPQDLAVDYIDFMEQEFPDSDTRPYGIFDLFLRSKHNLM